MVMIANDMSLFEFKCRFWIASVQYLKSENFEFRDLRVDKPTLVRESLRPTSLLLLHAQTLQAELAASVRRSLSHA